MEGRVMARRRTLRVSCSPQMLQMLRNAAQKKRMSVHAFAKHAIFAYIRQQKAQKQLSQLKKGYLAMGSINRTLANEALFSDEQQFFTYEHFLSESE